MFFTIWQSASALHKRSVSMISIPGYGRGSVGSVGSIGSTLWARANATHRAHTTRRRVNDIVELRDEKRVRVGVG